jgi:eukaryotic-like serine/threonine-protein kinase
VFLARLSDRIHPVLLDLGVAVERHATFVAGTALYGAPEQIAALGGVPAAGQLSEKMDSYGLASTLLCGLVGSERFPGEGARTPFELAEAFAAREERPLHPAALPDLTGQPRRALERALARWLQCDPDARPSVAQLADELEVLLEPEREAARAIEESLERQRRAHRRARLALAGIALAGIAAGVVVYGQRETLRLAAELRQARAEGAASFDKLDTCVAAHRLSEDRAVACELARSDDQASHAHKLDQLQSSSAAAEDAFSRRLTTVNTQLGTCREDATAAAEAFATERQALVDERHAVESTLREREATWREARTVLTRERDEIQRERNDLAGERDALLADKGRLLSEQASCVEARLALGAAARRCDGSLATCQKEREGCLREPVAPKEASAPPSEPSAG